MIDDNYIEESPVSATALGLLLLPRRPLCALAPWREISFLSAIVVFLVMTAFTNAGNWDRFRGPNGAGQSDDSGIPTKWEAKNFLWKQPMPGVGHSSPVIWDGRVFITSADPKTGAQIISAFDATTGKSTWEKRFDAGKYHMNSLNSLASSTPAVDAEHLYPMWLEDGHVIVVALTHDGNELWRRDIGPFEETHGFGKSPIVAGDLVIVANDSQAESAIVAVDRMSGEVRWKLARPAGITAFATPCVLDTDSKEKTLLATSTASGLTAINVETGKIIWQGLTDSLIQRCVASPIVAGGMVLVSCGQGGNGKVLVAARPGDKDHGPQEVYALKQGIPNVPTAIVAGDLLFLWHDRGVVSCYDLLTGHQNWRERVGGDYHSSPIRIGSRIFCVSMSGEVVVLAADKHFEVLARNPLNEACHATPAVANGRLYLRSESKLYCIGEPGSATTN
jgi:outer membrane protein assembly factor BamB